jgi:hypothetical protein
MAAIGPLLTDRAREVAGEEGEMGERGIFTLHVAFTHFLFCFLLFLFSIRLLRYFCVYLDFSITFSLSIYHHTVTNVRSQWPRGLRRRPCVARLLRFWVLIPPVAWMCVCCDCRMLSGSCLCDGLITRPDESYRLWRVFVCDQESSKTRRLKPATGL